METFHEMSKAKISLWVFAPEMIRTVDKWPFSQPRDCPLLIHQKKFSGYRRNTLNPSNI